MKSACSNSSTLDDTFVVDELLLCIRPRTHPDASEPVTAAAICLQAELASNIAYRRELNRNKAEWRGPARSSPLPSPQNNWAVALANDVCC